MALKKVRGKNLILLSLMLTVALFIGACADNEPEVVEPVVVDEPAVVEEEPVVVEEEPVVVEEDVEVVEEEADAVATTVDTATIVDTDVVTETEVMTETEVAEVIVETEVMTDTDVTVDTATEVETDVSTETADVEASSEFAIVVITDAAGTEFLGDPLSQQPIFAGQQEGLIVDERFEPIQAGDNVLLDASVDQTLFSEVEQDGLTLLTVNGRPVYRFVGGEGEDWAAAAGEAGLSPLTAEGEFLQ